MLAHYVGTLIKKRADLEASIFEHPPKDWSEFQQRLGQHKELNALILDLQTALQGIEDTP